MCLWMFNLFPVVLTKGAGAWGGILSVVPILSTLKSCSVRETKRNKAKGEYIYISDIVFIRNSCMIKVYVSKSRHQKRFRTDEKSTRYYAVSLISAPRRVTHPVTIL